MNLAILTAAHGRHALTRMFARYYKSADCEKVVVCTDEKDAACFGEDWHVLTHPNEPLGRKWNAGLDYVRTLDIDSVVILGSDDFVIMDYFPFIENKLEEGYDHIHFEGVYFYDLPKKRMVHCPSYSSGAGRCISRSLLEKARWKLWHDDINSGLDGSVLQHIRPINSCHARETMILDVKTGDNLWHLEENGQRRDGTDRVHEMKMTPVRRDRVMKHFPGLEFE